MSTSKGNINRQRGQKHQNKSAFKNDLYDKSGRTKLLNSLEIKDVCLRCKDIIEWKIKYKKYKMLNAPKKCINCSQRTIKQAYHVLCVACSKEKAVCAKCLKSCEINDKEETKNESQDILSSIHLLSERKRRTLLRYINKNGEENISSASGLVADIEKMLANGSLDSDSDDCSDDNCIDKHSNCSLNED